MTTLERMFREKTSWELLCPSEDYTISIDDIRVFHRGRNIPVSLADGKEIMSGWRKNDILYTYIEITPTAVQKILSGKDEYFKLEKVAVTNDKRIEFFFSRKESYHASSIEIDLEMRPSFTVSLSHKSGDIVQKTRVSVDADRTTHIEAFW